MSSMHSLTIVKRKFFYNGVNGRSKYFPHKNVVWLGLQNIFLYLVGKNYFTSFCIIFSICLMFISLKYYKIQTKHWEIYIGIHVLCFQWQIYIVKFWTRAPPGGPNSFNFMQFLGKFGKIVCWRPPWGVGAPSSGKSWIRHCIFIKLAQLSQFDKASDVCQWMKLVIEVEVSNPSPRFCGLIQIVLCHQW